MDNLQQILFEWGWWFLFKDTINIFKYIHKDISLLDRFVNLEHPFPIGLHLFFQINLQRCCKSVYFVDILLNFLMLIELHILLFLLGLSTCLPFLLHFFSGNEMRIHLVAHSALSLKHFDSFFVGCVLVDLIPDVFAGVAEQPLQEDNVILEHSFSHLLETCRLGYS